MLKRIATSLPGIGAALLPNATCPVCWPVYAGILSSFGLGFLMTGPYFYLFISILLGVSLFSLAYKAQSRRGYLPFWLGLSSAAIIIAGKFYELSDYVFYAGAILLIIASIWNNIRPGNKKPSEMGDAVVACPNCKTT